MRTLLDVYPNGVGCKITTDPVDAERRRAEMNGTENPKDCMMEGILCYDSIRGDELIEIGVTRTNDNKPVNYADFYSVDAIVMGGYVVYCRIIDDRIGRPVVKGVFYELPGSWWGESVADKLRLVQSTMNNVIKALFRNMAAASGPMYYVDISRFVDRDGTGLKVKPHSLTESWVPSPQSIRVHEPLWRSITEASLRFLSGIVPPVPRRATSSISLLLR